MAVQGIQVMTKVGQVQSKETPHKKHGKDGSMEKMMVRGIRGAITVEKNNSRDITAATQELLNSVVRENGLKLKDICSLFFTVTRDLNAQFPAQVAREMGWNNIPLMCAQELDISGSLPKTIRILMHVNTTMTQDEVKHVYLRGAVILRPDLAKQ